MLLMKSVGVAPQGVFFSMSKLGKSFLRLLFAIGMAIALLFIIPPAGATQNPCPQGMVMIPAGTFTMGSDNSGFVEERSAFDVTVSSFCIDKYEVTNAQFTAFVKATGYVTVAERPLSKEQFPDLTDEQRLPGSLVFEMAKPGAKQLSWWHWKTGANWQHPPARKVPSLAKKTTQSFILPMKMPLLTPDGQENPYPAKLSGNTPPVVG